MKRLWSEAGTREEDEQNYDKYQVDGVTIYLDKNLKTEDQVVVNLKSNLPLFGPTFLIDGVSLK